ncbi:MAG: hypothetical protein AUJ55_07610 [Proteobacteria bacterium CG1_02_64_396]|nr:MAG: hypothetical protein AUJ55_07610 [Proteobacteria bacterium CG1_02_64_396]
MPEDWPQDRERRWVETLLWNEALRAFDLGEVPIAAAVTRHGDLLGLASNATRTRNDPTTHAEIQAIRQACRRLENHRLSGATLWITVEPCLMCVGAAVESRIDAIVYGVREPKFGALSRWQLHPELAAGKLEITAGIVEDPARQLMRRFFQARRPIQGPSEG